MIEVEIALFVAWKNKNKNEIKLEIINCLFFENFIEASKIEQEYAQRFQQQTSYDSNTLPKHYGLSNSFYDDVSQHAIECHFDE